jgi:hypothetical protein
MLDGRFGAMEQDRKDRALRDVILSLLTGRLKVKRLLCIFAVLMVMTFAMDGAALERCKKYERDVKRFHAQYFGLDFPSGYSVADLHVESLCKDGAMSSDGIGSEGAAQITFRVWREQLEAEGIYEIHTISNHLRAHAFILRDAYDRAGCKGLWVMYQIYNGGPLVNKEITRAGSCDHAAARAVCSRKIITFKNGSKRGACDINYEYSSHIYRLGRKLYGVESDGGYQYW